MKNIIKKSTKDKIAKATGRALSTATAATIGYVFGIAATYIKTADVVGNGIIEIVDIIKA
jgi:hypothetical protein